MNYWQKDRKAKVGFGLGFLVIPLWTYLWGNLVNFDIAQYVLSLIAGYIVLAYIWFYPVEKMPKWVKRLIE